MDAPTRTIAEQIAAITPIDYAPAVTAMTVPPPAAPGSGAVGAPPSAQPAAAEEMPRQGTRYDGGFVIVDTGDASRFPFQVKVNNTTQFRFTQTQPDSESEFNNSYEYAAGVKWFPLSSYHLWLNGELIRVNKAPFSSIITPYNAGLTGWAPMAQLMFTF